MVYKCMKGWTVGCGYEIVYAVVLSNGKNEKKNEKQCMKLYGLS